MEVSYLRLSKKTGTYADSLAIAGLERLLYLLGAGRSRIEDRGGFYELILEAPVQLEDLDYESVRNSPGYTREGSGWELPERIEDPDSYEASRAESLTRMRPARRPA
jgi:hypothetical protein